MKKNRIKAICSLCGKSFERSLSAFKNNKTGKFYCSRKCSWSGNGGAISKSLKGHPLQIESGKRNIKYLTDYYKKGNLPHNFSEIGKGLICNHCRGSFDAHPHKIKEGKAKFCSLDCYNKHRSNPNRPKNILLRQSQKAKKWRIFIFEKDNYTCQLCKKKNCELNAHHIRPFSNNPKRRFDTNNGITLCYQCHSLIHKRKVKKYYCPDCGKERDRRAIRCFNCHQKYASHCRWEKPNETRDMPLLWQAKTT